MKLVWSYIAVLAFAVTALPNLCTAQSTNPQPPAFEFPSGEFPVLSWDLPHWSDAVFSSAEHGLGSLKQCRFNTAAFVRSHHLAEAQKLGLWCILAPQDFPVPWRKLSDEQIESAVKQLIDSAGGNNVVIGYFLADEPGAPDFPALAKAVAAVKRLAPGKLAYINLFPDYATLGAPDLSQLGTTSYSDYLEQYVAQVKPQFISYDNYRIAISNDQKDAAVAASYYQNLLEVRRVAMEHKLPFWNIVLSNRLRADMPVPSPANLLLQAYTTLAAGAQGLTWYTYYSPGYDYTPIDKAGQRTATWSYLKMVNDQVRTVGAILRPLQSTGVYFTPPLPAPSLPQLPGGCVKTIACLSPLMIGEFAGPKDESYALIANLNLRDSAQFTFTPANPHAQIRQLSVVDGSMEAVASDNKLWLTAGQGTLLKFD